jgi:hypothetical protein
MKLAFMLKLKRHTGANRSPRKEMKFDAKIRIKMFST